MRCSRQLGLYLQGVWRVGKSGAGHQEVVSVSCGAINHAWVCTMQQEEGQGGQMIGGWVSVRCGAADRTWACAMQGRG